MNHEKEYLIDNLAMLIDSGIDILNALKSLEVEAHSKAMKEMIAKIIADVTAGSSLSQAFDKNKMLPSASIALLQIGETSGQLSENLNLISTQNRKDRDFRSKIKSAMIYPALVISLTLIIGLGIAWFILPKLATVFSSLKLQLPFITKVLIGFGIFLSQYGTIFIPCFLGGLFVIIYFTFFYEKTKFIGENILFSLPLINKLIQEVEIARFGYLLGTLLDAGIPILEALDSICASPSLHTYKDLYVHLRDSIKEGNSFKSSFQSFKNSTRYIPHFVQEIIMAGEYSGNLSKSLHKIGKVYEEKTENNTKNLTVILEPIMLIIISAGVLGVAVAVILPIYSLVGNMNP
jgi:type IV pilus assembly protein PilC